MKNSAIKISSKALVAAVTALLCICMFALAGCGGSSDGASKGASGADKGAAASAPEDLLSGIHHAKVEVEGFSPFTIELNADEAPITVTNFVNLADKGYYDGLTFYRIQKGFVMQGGTKGNTASGNDPSLEPIKGEFSDNGVKNKLADDFKLGTVAMARTDQPDSATSTFFITLTDTAVSSLNGSYAAFGTIDAAGMEVVDAIVAQYGSFATGNMGMIADAKDQPVITSITIMD